MQNMFGGTPRGVLFRDFLIFQLKLALDGLKDAVVIPISIFVVAVDLVFGRPSQRGRAFYALMSACERFDQWLNLNGAIRKSAGHRDGLFGGSEPGDGSMVGDLEEYMRPSDMPPRSAGSLHGR